MSLVKGMRYGCGELCKLLDGLSERDLYGMREALDKTDDKTRVALINFKGCSKLALLRFDGEKNFRKR